MSAERWERMSKVAKFLARIARDKLGLEIRRAPRSTANRIRTAPPGRIVEFAGMPAVGKSYLMRNCLKALGPSYMTQEEIRVAANAADYRDIADPDIRALYMELFGHLQSLAQEKEHESQELDLQRQINRLLFYTTQLKSNMLIDAAYPLDALTDEGLVKNVSRLLVELAESGNAGARAFLRRRYIVLLEADPELTLSQIRGREHFLNRPFENYRGRSPEEILRFNAEIGPRYRARIEALQPWAAGVLRLSRSDSTRHNVEAVAAFVQRSAPADH